MRTIFFIIITILITACGDKSETTPEKQYPKLSYQALKPLVLKNNKKFRTAAVEQLQKQDYAAYFDLKQEPDKLQQKLNPIIKQLKQQANDAATLFTHNEIMLFDKYDETNQILIGSTPAFLSGMYLLSDHSETDVYPQYLFLLLANSEIAHNLSITPDQWQTIKQSLTVNQENRLDTQFTIEIKALRNNQFFQAIIKEIKIFSAQKELLVHLTEQRADKDIIANSLLSDGITLNLVPIHNFDYYRHRLLDPISDTLENRQACTKKGSKKGHASLSCRYPLPQATQLSLLIDIAGGLVVRIRLQSAASLTPEEQQKILHQASQQLGTSIGSLTDSTSWEHFGVKITFDHRALEQQTDDGQNRTIFDLQPISWINYTKE